jgi:(S)-mandelate dehydrogenase
MSTSSIEEVGEAISGGAHWFQLYVLKDPAISRRLMERAWNAGCSALIVTTDAVVLGNREADRRNYVRPQVLRLRRKIDVLMHPGWLFDVLVPHGIPKFGNLTEFLPKDQWSARDGVRFIAGQMENELGWRRIEEIRNAWPGKLVIKGILRPDDATRAAEIGADGIILSNHGGRQLDGAPSSIEQLPAVFAAAGDRCEILIDSGFRRGSDAFKALALGARGVLFGRAILYGLAAGREAGAIKAIRILEEEFRRTMGMAGCRDITEITKDRVSLPVWPGFEG